MTSRANSGSMLGGEIEQREIWAEIENPNRAPEEAAGGAGISKHRRFKRLLRIARLFMITNNLPRGIANWQACLRCSACIYPGNSSGFGLGLEESFLVCQAPRQCRPCLSAPS